MKIVLWLHALEVHFLQFCFSVKTGKIRKFRESKPGNPGFSKLKDAVFCSFGFRKSREYVSRFSGFIILGLCNFENAVFSILGKVGRVLEKCSFMQFAKCTLCIFAGYLKVYVYLSARMPGIMSILFFRKCFGEFLKIGLEKHRIVSLKKSDFSRKLPRIIFRKLFR